MPLRAPVLDHARARRGDGPVEFCTFEDMHAFHPIRRLTHAAQ